MTEIKYIFFLGKNSQLERNDSAIYKDSISKQVICIAMYNAQKIVGGGFLIVMFGPLNGVIVEFGLS